MKDPRVELRRSMFHDDVHCGIESFQLYRIDGKWKIVNFADTHSDCGKGD